MSYKKAMNAGAREKIKKLNRSELPDVNHKRTFGGKCSFNDCGASGQARRGHKNYCLEHANYLDGK